MEKIGFNKDQYLQRIKEKAEANKGVSHAT